MTVHATITLPEDLVTSCNAYCALMDIKPRHPGFGFDRQLLERAVADYCLGAQSFKDLNDNQRSMIAGLARAQV